MSNTLEEQLVILRFEWENFKDELAKFAVRTLLKFVKRVEEKD